MGTYVSSSSSSNVLKDVYLISDRLRRNMTSPAYMSMEDSNDGITTTATASGAFVHDTTPLSPSLSRILSCSSLPLSLPSQYPCTSSLPSSIRCLWPRHGKLCFSIRGVEVEEILCDSHDHSPSNIMSSLAIDSAATSNDEAVEEENAMQQIFFPPSPLKACVEDGESLDAVEKTSLLIENYKVKSYSNNSIDDNKMVNDAEPVKSENPLRRMLRRLRRIFLCTSHSSIQYSSDYYDVTLSIRKDVDRAMPTKKDSVSSQASGPYQTLHRARMNKQPNTNVDTDIGSLVCFKAQPRESFSLLDVPDMVVKRQEWRRRRLLKAIHIEVPLSAVTSPQPSASAKLNLLQRKEGITNPYESGSSSTTIQDKSIIYKRRTSVSSLPAGALEQNNGGWSPLCSTTEKWACNSSAVAIY